MQTADLLVKAIEDRIDSLWVLGRSICEIEEAVPLDDLFVSGKLYFLAAMCVVCTQRRFIIVVLPESAEPWRTTHLNAPNFICRQIYVLSRPVTVTIFTI